MESVFVVKCWVLAAAEQAAVAHIFSTVPLGTRGPIQGRQEVPGRLTSCLWSLSPSEANHRRGGLAKWRSLKRDREGVVVVCR